MILRLAQQVHVGGREGNVVAGNVAADDVEVATGRGDGHAAIAADMTAEGGLVVAGGLAARTLATDSDLDRFR